MILSDQEIKELCTKEQMISPFFENLSEKGVISYGLSSFGYDIRLSPNSMKVFPKHTIIDPKAFKLSEMEDLKDEGGFYIPPNSTVLAHSMEYFKIPADVMCLFVGKSTYARAGIEVLVTPAEPGWEGYLTLEIANLTQSFVRLYPREGICQALFFRGKAPFVNYSTRSGKYQFQGYEIVPPMVKNLF